MDHSSAGQLVYRSNGGAADTELIIVDASGQIVTTLPTEDE
jgi:hypothetical protein